MTQTPTDALRLVPRRATPQQLEAAAFNLSAEIGAAEAMKLGPHIERAYELLVAAAPASPLPGGGDWIDGTPEVPVGSPAWCAWATHEIMNLRAKPPAAPTGEPK